jgi:hypothetical protein
MIADIWPPKLRRLRWHRPRRKTASDPAARRIGGDWVVLIMISGLAATPVLLSTSRTAFGLVGLDIGEIIDF